LAPGLGAMQALATGGKAALLGLACASILVLAAARDIARGAPNEVLFAYACAGLVVAYLLTAFWVESRRALSSLQ
jgi:hypothetical protein